MKDQYDHIVRKLRVILLGFLLIPACNNQDFQDLDLNPQAANQIDLNFMFTTTLVQLANPGNRAAGFSYLLYFAPLIQHTAGHFSDFPPGDKYLPADQAEATLFGSFNTYQNISEILRQTGPGGYDEGNKHNLRHATKILRVFLFHRLTDMFGNVPYSQAGLATAPEPVFFPEYDHQSLIYTDLLSELEEATDALNSSALDEGFGEADLVYNGDIKRWIKLGHSLMLRLAMRISQVDLELANTYVAKAVSGGVLDSNQDNFVVPYAIGPNKWFNQNGLSRAANPGDGNGITYLSKTLVDFLKGTDPSITSDDDPRLMIISGGIAEWSTPDQWILYPGGDDPLNQKGMPNGYDVNGLSDIEGFPISNVNAIYSRINPKFLQFDEPFIMLSKAEVEFHLAEAAERGIGGVSDARGHYEAGVRSAMQMYILYDPSFEVTDAAVDDYLSIYPYASKDPLEMIGEQLWASLFLNWTEAFSAWRRTEYPELIPTNYPGNQTGGTIPQRIRYPVSEVLGNPNFSKGSTKPDQYTTRVWWAGGQ